MKKIIAIVSLISSFTSCEKFPVLEHKYGLTVTNVSPDSLAFVLGYEYPKIILPKTDGEFVILSPNAHTTFTNGIKWRDKISSLPADTLLLFAINIDTFRRYGYEFIQSSGKFKGYKKIAAADMQYDVGGDITYP